jgi:hypothetical protein
MATSVKAISAVVNGWALHPTCYRARATPPGLAHLFQEQGQPPAEDASPKIQMAYKLQSDIGQAIYRLRKCTVETGDWHHQRNPRLPQFSLRAWQLRQANGPWSV